MNLNQQAIHDFITRQLDLLRYEKTVRAEIFSLLDTMQTSVAEKLGNPNAQAVIDGVEKILNDGYALVLKALDVLPVLDAEFLWLYGWLGGLATAYKLRDKIVPFTKKAVNKIAQSFTLGGLTLPESVGKQRDDLLLKLKSLVRSADDKLGFSDLADTFNRAKQHAQTLSKTWINAVQNTAHEVFGRINPLVKAYRHVSVLDGDTSAVCTLRNGLLWNKKHEPIGHNEVFKRPPLHPNCRSKLVYVFNLKDEFQGISGDDWVKSRNLKELQEQFGKGIGLMLFDGKIKLSQAVDGLRSLSLTELRHQYTESVFSDNFKQRFAMLYHEVAQAKAKGMDLNATKQALVADRVWHISHISKQAQTWLGATTNQVWISEDTLVKQFFRHPELKIDIYQMMAYGINHAEKVVQLNDMKIALFKFDDEIFEIVVKTTSARDELFVVSIFKADAKEVDRISRKGVVLKE